MSLSSWDACWAGPGVSSHLWGAVTGLGSEVNFQKHLPETSGPGVCLATCKKVFLRPTPTP